MLFCNIGCMIQCFCLQLQLKESFLLELHLKRIAKLRVNIHREKESRKTSRSTSEDISLGRHSLTSKPRLTPR